MENAKKFLQSVNENTEKKKEEVLSSESSVFDEPTKAKPTKVFIIDKGLQENQSRFEWEKDILDRGYRESERVYISTRNSLHPFAVMSYLPYKLANSYTSSESSSSSSQTFSSSDTEEDNNGDQDSSFENSSKSSSSLRESFEKPLDAPKCHRGHIHK